jgi:hypothetical protein
MREDLAERIFQRCRQDPLLREYGLAPLRQWIDAAITAFFENDPYQATRIFMDRARGSFGLVVVSSTWDDRLVISSLGQPITIGFDPASNLAVYASEPAAVDAVLARETGHLSQRDGPLSNRSGSERRRDRRSLRQRSPGSFDVPGTGTFQR